MEQETKKSRKNNNKPYRKYLLGVVGLIIILVGAYYGYTYWQKSYSSPEAQAAAQVEAADEEKKKILESLSKLMILPEGDPVLFKVSNEETMRSQQAFFKDTKNDDVLLVFQESGKAIIFRPSTSVIVNSGPVNFDQQTNNTNAPANVTPQTETK